MIKTHGRWRHILAGTLAVSLAASLAACSPAAEPSAAAQNRTFTIYTDLEQEIIGPVAEAFTAEWVKQHGGALDVDFFIQAGGELRATLDLEAQAGDVHADAVVQAHSDIAAVQDAHGIFATLDIKGLDDPAIPESVRDPLGNGIAVPNALQPYLLVYNTQKVTGDEVPSSWADLLDERWRGRIGLGDPESTSGAHLPLWFLVKKLGDEIGAPYGWEFYERLGALEPTTSNSHGTILELVNAGELSLGILGISAVLQGQSAGSPVAGVLPKEGAAALINSTAVVKDGENQDVATAFAEWIVTKAGQEAMLKGYPALSIRNDVETNLPMEIDRSLIHPVDVVWVNEGREDHIERFRAAMKK